ncbi:MAG: sensor histidine kinase [Acidimicrobiales bacterium]
MSTRVALDRLMVAAVVVTTVVGAAFVSMLARQRPLDVYYELFLFHNGLPAVVLVWMSRLVLRRQPGNRAGSVLLAIALVSALHVAVAVVADARLVAAGFDAPMLELAVGVVPADLPLDASIPLWVMNWLWVPAPVLAVTMLPLVFPDGRLPSRRWRPVVAAAAAGAAMLVVAFVVDAWPTGDWTAEDDPAVSAVLTAVGGLTVLAAAVASLVALALRWRHADAAHRRQFQPVGLTAALLALVAVATYPWQQVWVPAVLLAFVALLVAYGLAVARYRLHDIEPFLGRAAVAAILSVMVAAVYAVVVIGVGGLAGRPFDNVLLPIVAVAVVALLIEPARRRARRLVDRLLYRADTDRTEVLSRVAAHANTSATAADVLAEVTRLLVRSTGAERAEAWLDTDPAAPAAAAGASDETAATLGVEVAHQGERFGELRLYARAVTDLVADAPQLVADVAHALGVVLRNDQLTAQLRDQLDELQASRRRLVEAHDHGRRSLERDIHDGAQSRLIALRLRLGVARSLAGGHDDQRLAGELDDLGHEVDAAVRSLRDLARGLAPPILEQSGPAAALQAHSRGLPIPVEVTAHGPGRYRPAVEGAVYFCCLEAIQNAIRHSNASTVTVDLYGDGTTLWFSVCDDGTGFDPNLARSGTGLANIDDRVSALGGCTRITSTPGTGTSVRGEIPAEPLSSAVGR